MSEEKYKDTDIKIEGGQFEKWGQPIFVREDGQLWAEVSGQFFRAVVPVDEELRKMFFQEKKATAWLLDVDEKNLVPPASFLKGVRNTLTAGVKKGEAVVYLFRKGNEWAAVVPKQEVSEQSWDVKDTKPMMEHYGNLGWELAGNMHLHPGAGTTPSWTDGQEWDKMRGGIFLIAGRTSKDISVHLQVAGIRWELEKVSIDGDEQKVQLLGERGETDWRPLVKERKYQRKEIRLFRGGTYTETVGDFDTEQWRRYLDRDRQDGQIDIFESSEFVAIPYDNAKITKKDGQMYVVGWSRPAAARRIPSTSGQPLPEVIRKVTEQELKKRGY